MPDVKAKVLGCGIVACLSLLALGCGPDLGSPTMVSGAVTVNGEPLTGAPLAFHALGEVPADHRTFTAMTDSGGQYKIDPIYPGEYEVMVVEAGEGETGEENTLANNPLQPAAGDELRIEIGSEPAVYDIKLIRK